MQDRGTRSITYQPALDGIRAVAVVLVLLFHLDLSWMSGGYLGVSVFFTLSGFLITTLLVNELQRSSEIRLGRFYGRRARRLLPASLVCIVGSIILIAAELAPDRSGLRWYIFGALFQFANWVPLALQDSYSELFEALSPTDHFWSLAIEEQFYWLWPVTMLGLFALVGGRRRPEAEWLKLLLYALAALYAIFAVSAPITAQLWSSDAAYFATWSRVPEILAGAVLAVFTKMHTLPAWVRHLAPITVAGIVIISVVSPAGRGFAYEGGLPLFAILSAALIAALQHPSPTRTALSLAPVVYLGRISYGVYLFHWPVFVVLTPARTDLAELPLAVVRITVTLAIAAVSFALIEQPILHRRVLPRPRWGLTAAALALPLVAVLGFSQVSNSSSFEQSRPTLPPADEVVPLVPASTTTTSVPGSPAPDTVAPVTTAASTAIPSPDTAPHTSPDNTADSSPDTSPGPSTVPPATVAVIPTGPAPDPIVPNRAVRMMVIGDSTALATATGLIAWADEHPELAQVEQQGYGGCGVVTEGERLFRDEWIAPSDGCVQLFDVTIPERIAVSKPDVVAIITSFWEVTDRRLGPDSEVVSILDERWYEHTLRRFEEYAGSLLDAGAPRVALVIYPRTDFGWGSADEPADDPQRYAAFAALERAVAATYPGQVSVVDLAAWSDGEGLTDDPSARPDGVHWTADVSTDIAERWLGQALIQAALG